MQTTLLFRNNRHWLNYYDYLFHMSYDNSLYSFVSSASKAIDSFNSPQ